MKKQETKENNPLVERMNSLTDLYIKMQENMYKYPVKCYILGFGWCRIKNREQHLGRIHELIEILHIKKEDLYEQGVKYNNLSGDIKQIQKMVNKHVDKK